MQQVEVKIVVSAAVEKVFASYSREFGDIYKYNPNLKHSFLLEDSPAPHGIGAMRRCELSDGKNWINEKITNEVKNELIEIDIFEGTVPLKRAMATFTFHPIQDDRTEVRMKMEFIPKLGLLGKLLSPIMKKSFKDSMAKLLMANSEYVTKGQLATNSKV